MDESNEGWAPVDGVGPPVERLALADLDLMSEATHPIRGRILRRLKQPRTVAELAESLDVPTTRLYHHVNRLVDVGLIRVVATRQVAAVTERRYQTAARSLGIDDELLRSTDTHHLSNALGSLFDVAKLGFQRFVESDSFSVDDQEWEHSVLSMSEIHLTDGRRAELIRRITELIEEFPSDTTEEDPDATGLHFFVAVNPDIS